MAVKDNEKNKEYVAKHRKAARATMGDEEYKKKKQRYLQALRRKPKPKKQRRQSHFHPLNH